MRDDPVMPYLFNIHAWVIYSNYVPKIRVAESTQVGVVQLALKGEVLVPGAVVTAGSNVTVTVANLTQATSTNWTLIGPENNVTQNELPFNLTLSQVGKGLINQDIPYWPTDCLAHRLLYYWTVHVR